jgi:hypothetical protein
LLPARAARRAGDALDIVLHDRVHLCVELGDRRAGFQPSDHAGEFIAAFIIAALLVGEHEWRPQLCLAIREKETVRHDADDAVRLAVEANVAADDAGIAAELILPQGEAEHGDVFVAGLRIAVGERAAKAGADAERREQARCRHYPVQALRRALGAQVVAAPCIQCAIAQRAGLLAPVEVVRNRIAGDQQIVARVGIVDVDQLVAVGIRQCLQQQRVDDAEHRAVRADAERERQRGGEREARLRQQHAGAVAQVLQQMTQHGKFLIRDAGRRSDRAARRGAPAASRRRTP